MEDFDFKYIQEMADAQKELDETFFIKNGHKRPTQLENNMSLMRLFGLIINEEYTTEEGQAVIESPIYVIVDSFVLDYFLDLWAIVLRSAEGRRTEDIRDWMLGKYLDMDSMNRQCTDTFFEFALQIIQYDPRTKLRRLVQLSELFGFPIELIHKEFMKLIEVRLSYINKEKEE